MDRTDDPDAAQTPHLSDTAAHHDEVNWTGIQTTQAVFRAASKIFSQGEPATTVMYVTDGNVRLSVLSPAGKEAVIAIIGPGHFFGESCLGGQTQRSATAVAITACTIVVIDKAEMILQLHARPAFADDFLAHVLTRNARIEEDLIDQLFNSSEKRLARTLLLLARQAEPAGSSHRVIPKVSQETLADIVGTTRSRVNYFMNKFRKLGFIEYNGGLKVNSSLLNVVLGDTPVGGVSRADRSDLPADRGPSSRLRQP